MVDSTVIDELVGWMCDGAQPFRDGRKIVTELCQRLSSIYTFVYTELTQGSFEKDIERIDNAIELMEYDRETWVMLLERIKEENGGSGSAAAAAAPTTPGAVPTGSTISFEG